MKLAGNQEQIFQHLKDNGVRFEAAGEFGPKLAAGALTAGALTGAALAALAKANQAKKLRQVVRKEVKKEIKSHQGPGLNFDLI